MDAIPAGLVLASPTTSWPPLVSTLVRRLRDIALASMTTTFSIGQNPYCGRGGFTYHGRRV
ncbi:hypothetical protein [Noviherbaspirillum aerium]|uniref:hypothetical protein n=1 Tax=Noviherbaspirillum aerium TaxID=2588497 RepID=UPI0021F458A6|nr:hypothetical protein [Noviherbaspirillum aerium]